MSQEFNIYCDESCHLERDRMPIMAIGGVWCPRAEVKDISKSLRALKSLHNAGGELKWIKVSPSRLAFYMDLIDFFFSRPSLNFRCLIVNNKSRLNHEFFNQGSHDSFYYKMYFYMLKVVLKPRSRYDIYLDIKDTRSAHKVAQLKEILCNDVFDFTKQMIGNIQHIRSHESELLQLADLLIGAVAYSNRNLSTSATKLAVVEEISKRAKHNLRFSTFPWAEKFNLFVFEPQNV